MSNAIKNIILYPMATLIAIPVGAAAACGNILTGNRIEKIKQFSDFFLQIPSGLLHTEASSFYRLVAGKAWEFTIPKTNGLFADKTTKRMANFIYSLNYVNPKEPENHSDEKVLRSFFNPKRLVVARVAAVACLIFCALPRIAEAIAVIPLGIASLTLHTIKLGKKLCTKNNQEEKAEKLPTLIDKAIRKVDSAFSQALLFPALILDVNQLLLQVLFANVSEANHDFTVLSVIAEEESAI